MTRLLTLALFAMLASAWNAQAASHVPHSLDAQLCATLAKDDAPTIVALVNRGANPNAACSIAECAQAVCKILPKSSILLPLDLAVMRDYAGSVEALLNAGALPNKAEPKYGLTAVFDLRSSAVGDLLFAHGADFSVRDKDGDTAIHYLLGRIGGSGRYDLSQDQAGDVLKILVGHGGNINAKDKSGGTVLLNAVTAGYPAFVKSLLDQGVDVNAHDNKGDTALGLAKNSEGAPILASADTYQQIETILRAHGATD